MITEKTQREMGAGIERMIMVMVILIDCEVNREEEGGVKTGLR